MKRREMILKSLQAGTVISLLNPGKLFSENTLKEKSLTGNPLRFPPVFTNGGTMTLSSSVVNVWSGMDTNVISINGSYPGPSVVIQKGDNFYVNFVNNLNEPATCHWHGVSVPEIMDGHPKDPILPGESRVYTYPVLNRAGTYFYHAHADLLTAKHVFKGFAGFYIVDDPAEIPLGLPRGAFDVPLCLQDRRLADKPQFNYNPILNDMIRGFLGDTVLVNGTPDAFFEVNKTLYRFRLLNGSNGRVYKIGFSDGRTFRILATDGGLKDSAPEVSSFFLSPGERVDILFDFSGYNLGDSVMLKSLPFPSSGGGIYRQGVEMNLLRFDITGSVSSGGIIPAALPPINYYNPGDAVTVREFLLSMTSAGMNMHRINGLTFDMDRIDWETPLNTLEEWKIINTTNNIHPMHSHSAMFQVFSRNGSTDLPPNDKGWKDTVLVNPFETVRTLIKFRDYTGIYLYHCHNLEHEDDGMMLNFRVTDNPMPVELASFIYSVNKSNVILYWTTSSEINNKGFYIERILSEEGNTNEWVNAGFVKGNGTVNHTSDYNFTDKNLNKGKYKFRLKQIDFNGNINLHYLEDEVEIGNPETFDLYQNYPNPFNPTTKIGFQIASDSFVTLKVFDIKGSEVAQLVNEMKEAGYYEAEFNSKNYKNGKLSSGIYIYRLQAGNYTSSKKMILLN